LRRTPEKSHKAAEMGILNDLLNRVKTVNEGLQTGALVRNAVVTHPADIMELQRQQLFAGKRSDGEDIRPYYSEDLKPTGFFYSVETAGRYSAMKDNTIRYPYTANKNPDAPNLYFNGRFHEELGVQFNADTVEVVATTEYAKKIMDKYGIETFGLMMANWMVIFVERGAYDELMDQIKQQLYA